jgi:hypothetical protein
MREEAPARTVSALLLFGLVPLALVYGFTIAVIGDHYAFDFHTFWKAGRLALDGRSPYPTSAQIARAHSATGKYAALHPV